MTCEKYVGVSLWEFLTESDFCFALSRLRNKKPLLVTQRLRD